MKRILSLFLSLCLIAALLPAGATNASAAGVDPSIEQTVRALGIMVGDTSGNMKLSSNVTRAEFVKMMVSASVYAQSADSAAGVSTFKDVKSSHWASRYVKLAVDAGWISGYVDATFRPSNTIRLEEAATCLLRLLGYASSDLTGPYPTAQLAKFSALKLGEGVSKTRGQTLTRADCMRIFYNLMNAATKEGRIYAQTLGYTVTNGKIDYSALILASMEGPYVASSGSIASSLPFTGSNVTVYRNGAASSLASVKKYDVYYVSKNLRTVWIFSTKAAGTYTAATPSAAAPTAVTVGGYTFSIGSSEAAYQLSSSGQFSIGDSVLLLLGKDGSVVSVVSVPSTDRVEYGVVTSFEAGSYTDSSGKKYGDGLVTVACTDGVARYYMAGDYSFAPGDLAAVFTPLYGQSNTVMLASDMALVGAVDADASTLGKYRLSDDPEILVADASGRYKKISKSLLAGMELGTGAVRYYTIDSAGRIDRLILSASTGLLAK